MSARWAWVLPSALFASSMGASNLHEVLVLAGTLVTRGVALEVDGDVFVRRDGVE